MIVFDKIRFKNLLSFGNQWSSIDFLNSKKTIILGSNGQGKSALIDAITFALFGKPFRKINKTNLINSVNKGGLITELTFSIKNIEYLIIRGQSPNIFEIYVDGKLIPQDASNRDYQKFLETDILKLNYRTFTQIVILGSGSYVQFMKLSTSAKREIIEDILDISVFSRMNEILKKQLKEEETNLRLFEKEKELCKSQYTFMYDKSAINRDSKDKRIAHKRSEIDRFSQEKENKLLTSAEIISKRKPLSDDSPHKERKSKLSELRVGINNNLKQADSEISFYTENDVCPKCKKSLEDDFKNERVSFLVQKKTQLSDALQQINTSIQKVSAKLKKITSVKNLNFDIDRQHQIILADIRSIDDKIEYLRNDIRDIELEDNSLIDPKEIELLKQAVKEADDKLKKQYHEIHVMKTGLGILKDTGAKTSIIRFYLPLINKTINDFLERFDFNISFTFDENFDESIRARHIDSFGYGNFSEGERMRIDLSLMFTWREIAKKKNSASTNLLFFDEVLDSAMDAAGLSHFMQIIDEYDPDANLFVISHREGVETGFDTIIQAKKENNFSKYIIS